MTENEAIKELETSIDLAKMCTQNYERKREIQGYEIAINALEEVQQYRALEKHLSDMFGGSLSLKMCVDELTNTYGAGQFTSNECENTHISRSGGLGSLSGNRHTGRMQEVRGNLQSYGGTQTFTGEHRKLHEIRG